MSEASEEWTGGAHALVADTLQGAGAGSLGWSARPGRWAVLLRSIDADGERLWGPWSIGLHASTRFAAPHPNPFRSKGTLHFELARPGSARLEILGVDGRLVRELVSRRLDSGAHHVPWDGRDGSGRRVASGVYLVRLRAAGEMHTQRLVLLQR